MKYCIFNCWLCSNYCLFLCSEKAERTCQDEKVPKTRGADKSVEPNRPKHATWTVRRELPTTCFRLSKSSGTTCTSMRILPVQETCIFLYSVVKHIFNCHLTAKKKKQNSCDVLITLKVICVSVHFEYFLFLCCRF